MKKRKIHHDIRQLLAAKDSKNTPKADEPPQEPEEPPQEPKQSQETIYFGEEEEVEMTNWEEIFQKMWKRQEDWTRSEKSR